jgi:hypothetical protein
MQWMQHAIWAGLCANLRFLSIEFQCICLYEITDIPKLITLRISSKIKTKSSDFTCVCGVHVFEHVRSYTSRRTANGKCCIMKTMKECKAVTTQAMVYPKQPLVSLKVPIHVRVWLVSPAGLGFQWVKLIRVWSVPSRKYTYEIYPRRAPASSSPRRTCEPDSYVYGHL